MNDQRCDKEGIYCKECMRHGTFIIGCCRKECGKHFYCDYCSKKDLYLNESSDKD